MRWNLQASLLMQMPKSPYFDIQYEIFFYELHIRHCRRLPL